MNIVAIVQARMGSTRFPGKVMLQTNGLTLIQILLERLSESEEITKIVVATTFESNDNPLANHVRSLGYDCEKGSESDLLDRYVTAARAHAADIVIRITGDCPLIDAKLVDFCIREFKQKITLPAFQMALT
jgi:glutamate-1-semialdehyde 2,1-aminomutase